MEAIIAITPKLIQGPGIENRRLDNLVLAGYFIIRF